MQFTRWVRSAAILIAAAAACAGCGRPSASSADNAASGAPALSSTADLKDKRIAVQLGTVYDIYATKTFPHATVLQFPTFQEVTLAVAVGKADAGLSDMDTLAEVMHANANLVPFGKPIFSSPVAAGFAKTSAAPRLAFNAFLRSIRQNGVWADMVDRWMHKRSQQMPELPAPATDGTIVVGIS